MIKVYNPNAPYFTVTYIYRGGTEHHVRKTIRHRIAIYDISILVLK